ncbi:pyruvate dehydrogenase complex dihydrolipoamide acetyltransferase [Candidatus Phycosocius spiralis]|uniref:Acetyltransferase component of pyruvate dehydrogenase complex n=1 Tax=Candidatus Phycosocius spiralis TaxID=2815099 RepID=A0ABQ4PYL5_9PROT|nr:pyruvate dehydrogenase complex dihydrolipoamide acetyltransferase [Candidatus Phycosocius spiralis]GIU68108.1 acetyltransferase component of pyruvate dehydrogenase complex [Candidatus Phycosocius spiralis]
MAIDILMPALSPTMEEGVLAKWHVKVGDVLKSGDVICEIETDKATMEVEAVDEGKVLEILVAEGTQGVKVNAVIARIEGEGAVSSAAPAQAPAPSVAPASVPPASKAEIVTETSKGERIMASPLAKRIAQTAGIDLAGVSGSGPHGRIVKVDVEAAMAGAPKPAPSVSKVAQAPIAAPVATPSAPTALPYAAGTYDIVPLDGMRRTVARRMTESFRDVPHFPLTIDLEIDQLLELRKQLNVVGAAQDAKVSVNDLVIKAAALACKRVPGANASYTPDGLLIHHHADIAVAVAIEGGLITPVIRKAETKGLAAISGEMKVLAEKARTRKLMPEDYTGGTFSISNLGMMGIKSFMSIINEPQGCILSVGAGEPRAVVKNGALAIATVMSVTLTCDHRVVDGAIGAAWLGAFKALIEEPIGLML